MPAMADGQAPVQMDLEKEMICSICTDILYEPLTLLDCLHTFCGACLKEWFKSQASSAQSLHPYTCPACRASVRGTKYNAWVHTMLDLYLQANPGKVRSQEERDEADKIYKRGDNVLPKLRRRERQRDHVADERLVHEVMALSLQDAGITSGPSEGGERRRRERSATGERRDSGDTNSRPDERQVGMYLHSREEPRHRSRTSPRREEVAVLPPERAVEHQSSLRSLLSGSEENIQEEIMRQIMEDGLLDGIDTENLTTAQEDEISERIAAAYRRRQEQRRRERRERSRGRSSNDTIARSSHRTGTRSRRNSNQQTTSSEEQAQVPTTPRQIQSPYQAQSPISAEASSSANTPEQNRNSRRRHRSNSATNPPGSRPRIATSRPAANSTSNLPLQLTAGAREEQRPTHASRRTTDPTGNRAPARQTASSHAHHPEIVLGPPPRSGSDGLVSLSQHMVSPRLASSTFPLDITSARSSNSAINLDTSTSASMESPVELSTSPIFPEPSISCRRCGADHIEYDLHYVCNKCDENGYHLCLHCYRQGEGCLHWYGFGWGASIRYEKEKQSRNLPPGHEPPHVLTASRYERPTRIIPGTVDHQSTIQSPEPPSSRLQSGVICDICHEFANHWYWRCDICNEGEWGFCNTCVNQGRHCTHPLISLQATDPTITQPDKPPQSPPGTSSSALQTLTAPLTFIQRTLTTLCDYCKYPIPPSNTRYHCPQCNTGDYDMHTNCYVSLVKSGRIANANGHMGWRRCLHGHRMVVLGFEDRDGGQKRIVVRDLVGGNALRDEDVPLAQHYPVATTGEAAAAAADHAAGIAGNTASSPRAHMGWRWRDSNGSERWYEHEGVATGAATSVGQFPPDGGVGFRMLARWGYFPKADVRDELMFPKGAEIKEADDINGDWFWGVYAGAKGLLPGSYVRMLSRG